MFDPFKSGGESESMRTVAAYYSALLIPVATTLSQTLAQTLAALYRQWKNPAVIVSY